ALPRGGARLRLVPAQGFGLSRQNFIGDVGGGGDEVQLAVALDPLLNDLAVQHAQKAASKAEAEPLAVLGLVGKAGVVELELAQGFAQILEFAVVHGVEAGE